MDDLTDDDRQQMRRAVAAWAEYTRQMDAAANEARRSRDAALYAAILADVPWRTAAADAGISLGTATNYVRRHVDRNNLPYPDRRYLKNLRKKRSRP